MTNQYKVAILLPTYNGQKYLEEQLQSIINQTYNNFIVVIRDDSSTDNTRNILERYKSLYSHLFHIVVNNGSNYGARENFSYLINYTLKNKVSLGLGPCYILFCDQDDIWEKDKISIQMDRMIAAEATNTNVPILVHCDLQVVDQGKNEIAKSFMKYQGLEPSKNKFRHQIISNIVTGCTSLINEPLAKKAIPIPRNSIMHDWWLSMCATAFGKLIYIPIPMVKYRQHGGNTIGAKEFKPPIYLSRSIVKKILRPPKTLYFREVVNQAKAFLLVYRDELTKQQRLELYLVIRLNSNNALFQRCLYKILRR